jgi:hypothetical protein
VKEVKEVDVPDGEKGEEIECSAGRTVSMPAIPTPVGEALCLLKLFVRLAVRQEEL